MEEETKLDTATGLDVLADDMGTRPAMRYIPSRCHVWAWAEDRQVLTTRPSPPHPLVLCCQYHDDRRQQGEPFCLFRVLRTARRVSTLIITSAVRRVRRELHHDLFAVGYPIECLCFGRHYREEAGFHLLLVDRHATCKQVGLIGWVLSSP